MSNPVSVLPNPNSSRVESFRDLSFRTAAFAAAICSLRAADEAFEASSLADLGVLVWIGIVVPSMCEASPSRIAGPNASDNAGRGFALPREAALLTESVFIGRVPLDWEAGTAGFDGEGELGDCGTECLALSLLILELLLTLLCGVKPKPPRDVLEAGFALAGSLVAIDDGLTKGFAKLPSLVPGLLVPLLPLRLRLEAGRGGGPIGLSVGEKKLDRRLPLGVDGKF